MEYVKQILDAALPVIATFVVTLLGLLAKRAIKALEDKTKVGVAADLELLLQRTIASAVAYAEEQAHKQLKSDKPLDGKGKLDAAVRYAKVMIQNSPELKKFAATSAENLEERIEALLGAKR